MPQLHVNNLFPTPVLRIEGFLSSDAADSITAALKSRSKTTNARTDLLSHTEPLNPKNDPQFDKLSVNSLTHVNELGFLLFGQYLNWSIKEMWLNILSKGGHQVIHTHANSFISGVIYLTDHHPSTHTTFHKCMGGDNFIFSNHHKNSTTTPYNGDHWVASDVKKGDLVLFPSYLLHSVPQNEGEERMTIAFNAIPDELKSWDYTIRFSE